MAKTKYFKKYLKAFIQNSLSSCEGEYLKNKQTYSKIIPMVNFLNQTRPISYKKIIDHKKLVISLKTTITKYPEVDSLFKIIKNILKTEMNSAESKSTRKRNVTSNDLKDELFYCLIYYLENHGFEFNKSNFDKTFSAFDRYLQYNFHTYCYLTPLYNFDGNFERCQISSASWIQKIPCNFYNKIINLDQNTNVRDVPSYQRQLKYVLFCSIETDKTASPISAALEIFENILNTLKLFQHGDPRFGDMFGIASENWPGSGLKVIERGHEKPPSLSSEYVLNSKEINDLTKFYKKLNCKISELGKKSNFLESAIRRYGMAFHHRKSVDKIVDHVICLESLLVPHIGDATLKLAHRMAALLGNHDVERIQIWKFVKESYKFRSGYLHQSTERTFKIDSEPLDLDKVSDKLECFSRVAIKRIIRLLEKYDSQEQIVDELDQAVYVRSRLKDLEKIWKD